MSETKQGSRKAREPAPKNEAASVDWAEKLKASMNRPHDEATAEASEYDDLAALLREQLSKSERLTVPEPTSSWVTEEFEAPDDGSKSAEEYSEEDREAVLTEENSVLKPSFERRKRKRECRADLFDDQNHFEEETDEIADDSERLEEPKEEILDLLEQEDETDIEDGNSEEIPDDCEWNDDECVEGNKEPQIECMDSIEEELEYEEYDDERDEDLYEDLYDSYTSDAKSNERITKEILDRAFGEEFVQIPSLQTEEPKQAAPRRSLRVTLQPTSPVTYQPPSVDAWTDDRLNGDSTPLGVGSPHLRDLALENQRLITESENPFGESAQAELSPATEDVPGPTLPTDGASAVDLAEKKQPRQVSAPQIHIPLQLGLDDISPTVPRPDPSKPRKAEKNTRVPDVGEGKPGDYTARMAHNREEEAALGDTELFMRLGYEEELRRTDEQSRLEQLHVDADTHRHEPTLEIPSVRLDGEYRGREDTAYVEEAYVRGRRRNTARLVIAAVGALVGLFYDLAPTLLALFGESLDTALGTSFGDITPDKLPYYIPVGLAWTLLICLPFLSRLGRGLRSLLSFEPTRYAVSSLALIVTFAGGAVAWLVGDPYELPLFCGSALLMLFIASLSELLLTEGEYHGFSVVSTGKTACILTDDPTSASASLKEKTKRDEPFRRERDRRIFTVVRTGRVADYFARTCRYNPYMGRLNYLLPVALLVSIASAGLSLALGGDTLTDGVRAFQTAYLICLPSAYLLSLTLPLCTANAHLRKKGAAIIGSAAPADYAVKESAHLIYPDGDALKALHRMNITLRGDPRSEEYRRIANVVFRLLNTPLADDPILHEEKLDHYRIEISERGEQYLRLYLVDTQKDSATEIMMGSHHALTRRGVRLPRVSMEKQYKKGDGCHVMYLAFNRNFHLAYGVEYRVGRTFGHMVSALNKLGYEVDLSTYDPMFDPSMDGLARLRKHNPVEVVCPENFDSIRKARSGGIVVTGRSLELQYPLGACRSMLAAYRRGYLYSWLSLPAGVAAVALSICFGLTGLLSSALVALWQLMGVGITLWITLATTLSGIAGWESRKDGQRSSKESKDSKKKK